MHVQILVQTWVQTLGEPQVPSDIDTNDEVGTAVFREAFQVAESSAAPRE